MNVFLTGATGYIGSRVLLALIQAGHSVTALVRDPSRVRAETARLVTGDMRDRDLVRGLAAEADAVIATAAPGDATSAAADNDFVEAVLAGLRPGATLVRTGGIWVYGSGDAITEESPLSPPAIVAWREEIDRRALTSPGIRSLLVEPGVVYGDGAGIPAMVFGGAQLGDPAALQLIGPGTQHWATVHVDDLAELYVATLTHGSTGDRFLGVGGDSPSVASLADVASRRLGLDGRVVAEDPADTVARLGAFGEALLMDQQASGEKARQTLDWKPSRPTLLEVFAAGEYDPS
ncbi:NAD-dependent epimerase/dehydratase family protein [Actinoplanes sp. LDG1-06]|uniref:NAD-dependent epimerase/dehydratase family protein n=1 Tax=Paractinoplanes ovalisporus TaxID=2810368 RepID=A0ABS2AMB4_9ACTN|nr:NAD-dependent epimerase/dehydratase family protein [Actinoplanes ovalisporus]MBM2620970.1 NAD-dependent epimerase/dehydratase family protein [Actinoplanes ovalisporus]